MKDSHTQETMLPNNNKPTTSFGAVIVGLAIIIISMVMIFVNERNQAQKIRSTPGVVRSVITIEPLNNPEYENALVHIAGMVTSPDVLLDEQFGFSFDDVLKYRRTVEMYQWQETQEEKTKDKLGGGQEITVTTTYDKVWSSQPIDSGAFVRKDYINPTVFPLESINQQVGEARINDILDISPTMVGRIAGFETYVPTGEFDGYQKIEQGAYLYQGQNYNQPDIGDIRISFSNLPESTYSFIGLYTAGQVREYTGKKQSIGLVTKGVVSVDDMIAKEQSRTRIIGWVLRGGALVLMFVGLVMVFGPLQALARLLPVAKKIIGGVSRFLLFFIALLLSMITTSVAWIIHRPIIGGLLIVGTLGIAVVTWKIFKKNTTADTLNQNSV